MYLPRHNIAFGGIFCWDCFGREKPLSYNQRNALSALLHQRNHEKKERRTLIKNLNFRLRLRFSPLSLHRGMIVGQWVAIGVSKSYKFRVTHIKWKQSFLLLRVHFLVVELCPGKLKGSHRSCSYRIYSAIRRGFHLSRMTTNVILL